MGSADVVAVRDAGRSVLFRKFVRYLAFRQTFTHWQVLMIVVLYVRCDWHVFFLPGTDVHLCNLVCGSIHERKSTMVYFTLHHRIVANWRDYLVYVLSAHWTGWAKHWWAPHTVHSTQDPARQHRLWHLCEVISHILGLWIYTVPVPVSGTTWLLQCTQQDHNLLFPVPRISHHCRYLGLNRVYCGLFGARTIRALTISNCRRLGGDRDRNFHADRGRRQGSWVSRRCGDHSITERMYNAAMDHALLLALFCGKCTIVVFTFLHLGPQRSSFGGIMWPIFWIEWTNWHHSQGRSSARHRPPKPCKRRRLASRAVACTRTGSAGKCLVVLKAIRWENIHKLLQAKLPFSSLLSASAKCNIFQSEGSIMKVQFNIM